ncbi:MAG TPA: GNAT family N-acetyltransferase [Actinospica sp.]|nr:GNAT family N-acetyltransferase [Actinospica sp.]
MPGPGWTLTADPLRFANTATLDFLRADPIGNTVALGVAIRLHLGPREPQPGDCYGWWTNAAGEIGAAFLTQDPFAVTLSAHVPEQAARTLASAWLDSGRARPSGVFGPVETAEAIAADFAKRTGGGYRPKPQHSMRLFTFAEPAPPDPAPRGAHRLAALADLPRVARWDRAFLEDCGIPATAGQEAITRDRIAEGRAVLWTVEGEPVALAHYSPVVAETSRITGVYTPPEHRKNGYAAGVTWAVAHIARDAGARHVLLHTDLSNPTSNGVYQRLGFRPVHDVSEFEFTD